MKTTKLSLLTVCMFFAQQSYALELLKENELSDITGQDGITINYQIQGSIEKDTVGKVTSEAPAASIDQLNWYDPNNNTGSKMGLGLHNVKIYGIDGQPINSQFEFDVGATDYGAGLRLSATISPFKLKSDLNLVTVACENDPCGQNDHNIRLNGDYEAHSMGGLEITTASPFSVILKTTAGLFNKNSPAFIDFNLNNASIKHTMGNYGLALENFNFSFSGEGYIYLDPIEGIVLTSNNGSNESTRYIHLEPTPILNEKGQPTTAHAAGVNFDLRYHKNNNDGTTTKQNIMRYGISGSVKDARLSLGANQEGNIATEHQTALNAFDITNGKDKNAASSLETVDDGYTQDKGGLHLNLSAAFVNSGEENVANGIKATTLEIGHTGKDSYAIQFKNLRTLTGVNPAYIDFGNIYINTLESSNLEFKINNKIREVLGYSDTYTVNQELTSDSVLVAIRAMDFQAIAGSANFISNDTGLPSSSGTWGIGLPIYNLNANIALSGTTVNNQQALAYNIIASTDGYGIDKVTKSPSTTSILIIDGDNDYYAGLRNINAFLKSSGTISYEDRGIHIAADELLIAADAELAIGKLPDIENPNANFDFTSRQDVLANIGFKLDGEGNLFIIPGTDSFDEKNNTNFLSLEGDFKFRPLDEYSKENNEHNLGSYFAISNIDSDGTDEKISSVIFGQMQGHLGFESNIKVKADTVVLDSQVKFNKENDLKNVFRTNFAMRTTVHDGSKFVPTTQNMAHIAITGGNLRSTLGIKPR